MNATQKVIEEMNQEILDEMVHECLSQDASDINNQGKEEQIRWLVDRLGPDNFLEEYTSRRT